MDLELEEPLASRVGVRDAAVVDKRDVSALEATHIKRHVSALKAPISKVMSLHLKQPTSNVMSLHSTQPTSNVTTSSNQSPSNHFEKTSCLLRIKTNMATLYSLPSYEETPHTHLNSPRATNARLWGHPPPVTTGEQPVRFCIIANSALQVTNTAFKQNLCPH